MKRGFARCCPSMYVLQLKCLQSICFNHNASSRLHGGTGFCEHAVANSTSRIMGYNNTAATKAALLWGAIYRLSQCVTQKLRAEVSSLFELSLTICFFHNASSTMHGVLGPSKWLSTCCRHSRYRKMESPGLSALQQPQCAKCGVW